MRSEVKLYLDGMYCRECKDIISLALNNEPGIIQTNVSYSKSSANIVYENTVTDVHTIIGFVKKAGYSATEKRKDMWLHQIVSLLVIIMLAFLFRMIFSYSMGMSIKEGMSYGFIFIIGLTGSFHCVGMCGGIMLTQTSIPDNLSIDTKVQAIVPASAYNLGRVISYTAVGAIVGAIGSIISVKASVKGTLFIAIGIIMMVIALQMLHIIPRFEKMPFQLPQSCSLPQSIRQRYSAKPFIIGLLTGLMPCGQLQSMQLFALSTGSAVAGAGAMFIFSVGTVPLMLILGDISTLASRRFKKYMVRISGITITALSILLIFMGFMVTHKM